MKARDMLPILVAGVLFGAALYTQRSDADGPEEGWTTDLPQALNLARKTHRLVLVEFGATWCGPCQEYRRKVFPSDGFKKVTKDVVLVNVDIDQQTELAKSYGVGPIPDIRFFDPNGKQIGQVVGLGDPDLLLVDVERHKDEVAKAQS